MEYGISGYQSDYRYVRSEVVELAHESISLAGNGKVDQIYLLGMKEGDQLIYHDITLVIESGVTSEREFYPIPTSKGMGGGIDLVDFSHNGQLDIGVYIFSGGTGNQVDYYIFFNHEAKMMLGFSNKMLEEKLKFQVSYLPNYQVEIKNLNTQEVTVVDVSKRSQDYLEAIYNEKGELKQTLKGVVVPVSRSSAIKSQDSLPGHDLVLTQRILGRSHNDTLGYVHSNIGFKKGSYFVYRTSISQ